MPSTLPACRDDKSLEQWWSDVPEVNQTFHSVLELTALGSDIFQYDTEVHKLEGGFFPLDELNPTQKSRYNMSPYWNPKFFPACAGEQYLFPPRVTEDDCPFGDVPYDGCWLTDLVGLRHDYYFTYELRTHFVYDGDIGMTVQVSSTDDLYVFIDGKLVLDLGGTHGSYSGKVVVAGQPGTAKITEGGCLDGSGNIIGAEVGSHVCCPLSGGSIPASTPNDFRVRSLDLGIQSGEVYELAIFGANRHPTESALGLRLSGLRGMRSVCAPSP
jgi:fibro-slime domain-containing protein